MTAAAMAAMRQQMCSMVDAANLVAGFNLPPHMSIHPTAGGPDIPIPQIPKVGTPMSGQLNKSGGELSGGIQMPRLGSPAISSSMYNLATGMGLHGLQNLSPHSEEDRGHRYKAKDRENRRESREHSNENDKDYSRDKERERMHRHRDRESKNNNIHSVEDLEHHPLSLISNNTNKSSLSITRLDSLEANSNRNEKSPNASPKDDGEPAIDMAINKHGSINGDDSREKSPASDDFLTNSNRYNDSPDVKMEPLTECRE